MKSTDSGTCVNPYSTEHPACSPIHRAHGDLNRHCSCPGRVAGIYPMNEAESASSTSLDLLLPAGRRCGTGGEKEKDENADARSGSAIRRGGEPASVMPWGHEVCGLVAAAQGR